MSLFRGNTEDCIKHFAGLIEKRPDRFLIRNRVASFVGTGDAAVYRWFSGKNPPVGETLIKFRFYLEHQGYEVTELKRLRPEVRNAGRLYAFGAVTISELAILLGHPKGRGGIDTLLAVLRGIEGISQERSKLYQEFISAYSDQLPKLQQVLERLDLEVSGTKPVQTVAVKKAQSLQRQPALRTPINSHEAIVQAFTSQVKALAPLAEIVESEEFTAEERAQVRELAGGDGIFKIANMLYRLCGERARKMHQQQ